ncbi:MAG: hypothetical protein KGJ62_08185 [Armatimonadetes bacterium]|nr:hypothetical protein [Armatimonadota bacterium]MDE2205255.1 hypothetical protein [Armatimonadota bacterium]
MRSVARTNLVALAALAAIAAGLPAAGQAGQPVAPAPEQRPPSSPGTTPGEIPSLRGPSPAAAPPPPAGIDIYADALDEGDVASGFFMAHGHVKISYGDTVVTADRVQGNDHEIILSGSAKLVTDGVTSYATAVHIYPREQAFRVDQPRATFQPSFLQNRITSPLFVNGGAFEANTSGYALASGFAATTCILSKPHYELLVGSAEVLPHQRIILRHVGVVLFGAHLLVLPEIVIPLNNRARRLRTNYLPEVGENLQEGYFARFPYTFAEGNGAATFTRFDVTQKRGEGYRIEQDYLAGKQRSAFDTSQYSSGAQSAGAYNAAYGFNTFGGRFGVLGSGAGPENGGFLALQGYFADGFSRNFSATYQHQQSIGSGNHILFSSELDRNSYGANSFGSGIAGGVTSDSSQRSRFDFSHQDAAHGVQGDLGINLSNADTGGLSSSQLTADYRQSFDFGSSGTTHNSLNYEFDLSRYLTSGSGVAAQNSATLDSSLEFQHTAPDYQLTLSANDTTNLSGSRGLGFGTLEKLPELMVSADTYNFKRGWLHRIPAHLEFGMGQYSEPANNTVNDRLAMGFTVDDMQLVKGATQVTYGGGFEQRIYSDGAAQYQVQQDAHLRQRLWGRSGFDLSYNYQQPEGGTPFLFDTYTRTHDLALDAGYIDDQHVQLTLRTGYDFLGTSQSNPWQLLSAHVMLRPNNSLRYDALATFDPNRGRLFGITNSLKIRGRHNTAIDLYAQYDPTQHAGLLSHFPELDSQFTIPFWRNWRIAGLLRFNGQIRKFESRNIQLTRDWDCMQASFSYTESTYGFGVQRSIYFILKIKALPFFHSFDRGPSGQSLGPSFDDFGF